MDNNKPRFFPNREGDRLRSLKEQVNKAASSQNLQAQRKLIESIATELNLTMLDCAAALLYINEAKRLNKKEEIKDNNAPSQRPIGHHPQPGIKLVRYRVGLGSQHQINMDELKKVLVEESGVDIKNIANVRIQDAYTLIDLPDEMPQEIYHHLKTVAINDHMLDIRRVKPRNKKRSSHRHRHQARAANVNVNGKEVPKIE